MPKTGAHGPSFDVGAIVLMWESLLASSEFDVVRLKNKIGKCKEPFNLHANVLFKPDEWEDPILCELICSTVSIWRTRCGGRRG